MVQKKAKRANELRGLKRLPAGWESHMDSVREALDGGREDKESSGPKTEVIKECSCGGQIVRITTTSKEYNPLSGPPIIGPGSRRQYMDVVTAETFCSTCKLMYHNSLTK